MKIITEHINPPIPVRSFDWSARYEDSDEDSCTGYGETEQDAIKDLIQQTNDLNNPLPDGKTGKRR